MKRRDLLALIPFVGVLPVVAKKKRVFKSGSSNVARIIKIKTSVNSEPSLKMTINPPVGTEIRWGEMVRVNEKGEICPCTDITKAIGWCYDIIDKEA